jgi:hypothetical protein
MLLGSLAFVAIGVGFVISPPTIAHSYLSNSTTITITGLASIIFFGLCAYFLSKKLPDNKPGLIIDPTGLTDNSSGVAAGKVLWEDIEEISVMQIQRQKLIMLQVSNPQVYIDKQTSGFKRKMMQLNYKMYGTPLSINSNGLKISFDALLSTLTDRLNAAQQ